MTCNSNKILHGDCLQLMKDIPDGSVDLIVTDPPYGINYKSGAQKYCKRDNIDGTHVKVRNESFFDEIIGDDVTPIEWLKDAYRVLKENTAIYVFCCWRSYPAFKQGLEDCGFKTKNLIVLNKSNHGMGDLKGQYAPKHELLLYANKGRHVLNRHQGRMKDVWDVKVKYSGAIRLHPNEKPCQWYEIPVLESSKEGDLVLDPFAGSGTLGKVCQDNSRQFILMEEDEKYFEVIKNRLGELPVPCVT